MKAISRRHYLGLSAGAALCPRFVRAEAARDDGVVAFMKRFAAPGLSIAIAKDGVVIRREAFGLANIERKEALDTAHRFRIASVSKPITSTAIFLLIERDQLQLDDLVFGKNGRLGIEGPDGISVRHLLTHTSGGWTNNDQDPMFRRVELEHADLIPWALDKYQPENPPGKTYAYSNFGYCLLGRVIEKVSGQSYQAFVRENVLKPSGAAGMTIGKGEREVGYYTDGKPETFEMNIARMDAHGGWVGSPSEMVDFALRVDGFAEPSDLLKEISVKEMIRPGEVNRRYACGWNVNRVGNYWHGGSLPGLSSLLVRTASGYCWAACVNTRTEGIGLALDRLMWELVRAS